jgi:uncharacterized protein (TIGR03086 family)
MTREVADIYRRRAADYTRRVEAVPADRWENPSPCEDWTARDVVRHTVETSGLFLGFIGSSLPAGPSVDDDPVGAWRNARDAIQAALDDPDQATKEYDGFTGKSTFEAGVKQFLSNDLVVHGWDLARATGGDDRMDPNDVREAFESLQGFDEKMMRSPGAFGPAVEPPPDADDQARLLAFLGRRP